MNIVWSLTKSDDYTSNDSHDLLRISNSVLAQMSTETLDKGLQIIRGATMSLDSDPQFAEMMKEKERLLVSKQLLLFIKLLFWYFPFKKCTGTKNNHCSPSRYFSALIKALKVAKKGQKPVRPPPKDPASTPHYSPFPNGYCDEPFTAESSLLQWIRFCIWPICFWIDGFVFGWIKN